jgi:hypothetical protein
MPYEPNPIDTRGATLPEALDALRERLAEHNHDVWARQRMADGWTYGPARDDARKQHPDLVPYAALGEAEKVYDRNSVDETLKAIVALGYRIVPGGDGGGRA